LGTQFAKPLDPHTSALVESAFSKDNETALGGRWSLKIETLQQAIESLRYFFRRELDGVISDEIGAFSITAPKRNRPWPTAPPIADARS
jgi:hypothetical protein